MDREITSKQLVRGVFESVDLPRLPFVPWVFTHAARLEQIIVRDMFDDPTRYSRCLQNTRKLYDYDAITGSFDPSLELEICGSSIDWKGDFEAPNVKPDPYFDFSRLKNVDVERISKTGRFGTVIESLRRINMVSGKNTALAAVVSGPLTVASSLIGINLVQDFMENSEQVVKIIEATAAYILKIVQVYSQLQLDIIAIADRLLATLPPVLLTKMHSFLSPVVNTIKFYNAYSVLLPGDASFEKLSDIIDLGFDGIVVSAIQDNTWTKIKSGRNCVLGKAIPSCLFNTGKNELQEYLETYLSGSITPGVFLTTDWEVPSDTSPGNFHLVMDIVSRG